MTETQRTRRRVPFWQMLLVAGLLAVYFILAVTATLRKCTTYDEIHHMTAGYSFWRFNDYRCVGNWPQRWAALPLLWSKPAFPSDQPAWHISKTWETASQFFYFSGNDPDGMLLQGRIMSALLGVVLGALVFWYARRLLGTLAGFLSLTLFVICPTLLANGALIAADLPSALFFLASLPALWWVMHEITPGSIIVGGLVLGGLFLTKYSAVIMVPVAGALLLLRLADGRPLPLLCFGRRTVAGRLHLIAAFTSAFAAIGGIIWALIWVSYGCRFAALNNPVPGRDQFGRGWERIYDNLDFSQSTTAQLILWMRDWRLLPESYLYFFAGTLRTSLQRESFLNGEYSAVGFPAFFPYSFLVKTPLGIFAVLLLAGLSVQVLWNRRAWRGTWQGFYATAPLWFFLAAYWATAVTSHINIGHRHILPTYPVMFILAGAAARFLAGGGPAGAKAAYPVQARILCGLLLLTSLGWAAVDSLRSWPNYLTYFNAIAGGPKNGYKHLVDSSLDWGQDLPDLKKWLDDNDPYRRENVYLYYFGKGPFFFPTHRILHAQPPPARFQARPMMYVPTIGLLGSLLGQGPLLAGTARIPGEFPELPEQIPEGLLPGIYCISATHLQGIYVGRFWGPWKEHYEKLYQMNLTFHWAYNHRDDPESRLLLEYLEESDTRAGKKENSWRANFVSSYHELRFIRLLKYLRENRVPDDQVNHTIMIYRVTAEDLEEAFRPMVLPE